MTVELMITGMTCLDCSRHVARALERVAGVTSATVDYRGGGAVVEVDSPVPVDALLVAVERAGYHAERSAPATVTEPPVSSLAAGATRWPVADLSVPSDFDLLIIGTGGAGVAAAIQAASTGARVAIAEDGTLGGTCVNVGCIPSKNLIEAAAYYHTAQRGFPGISGCVPTLDWKAVLGRKDALVAELRQSKYADVLASYPNVTRLDGRARLLGDGRVSVGELEYRPRKIIVATGASPATLLLPGIEHVGALNSTTAMALGELPKSMIVLGGSAVGLELGQTFARFGVRVIVVELAARILPNEDEAISIELAELLVAEGIEIHTGMTATRVEQADGQTILHVSHGSLTGQLTAERLLIATGRRPNTGDLGLADAGVQTTPHGFVIVDSTMRTSNPDIYAAGDVTGGPGYVYVAAAGARVAAENAMRTLSPPGIAGDAPTKFDLSVVPNVTFTAPQVASVGLTEAQARQAGYNVQVSRLELSRIPRAIVTHQRTGFVKMVSDATSGRVLGVHALAPHAGELMGEAALAVRFQLTVRDLAGTLHPYLTWAESMKLVAQGFSMDINKLSCCA